MKVLIMFLMNYTHLQTLGNFRQQFADPLNASFPDSRKNKQHKVVL